jgi:hypothetical protein
MSRFYIEEGIQIQLAWYSVEDIDWKIVLEQMRDKEHPLRELEIRWGENIDQSMERSFIELIKIIQDHKTLIKLNCTINKYSSDTKTAMFLEALKDNRSIKHITIRCNEFDSNTADALARTLMNNQTWHTLNLWIFSACCFR